ncbi:unnamed protein product [Closterium sp. Yama58-4]|nr:unnamed protein product [Closterium sp. Yama58-4]
MERGLAYTRSFWQWPPSVTSKRHLDGNRQMDGDDDSDWNDELVPSVSTTGPPTPESPPASMISVLFQGVRVSPWHDVPLYPADDEDLGLDPLMDSQPRSDSLESSSQLSHGSATSATSFRMICTNPAGKHRVHVISPTDGQIVASCCGNTKGPLAAAGSSTADSATAPESASAGCNDDAGGFTTVDFPWNCGVLPQTAAASSAAPLADADVLLPVEAVDIAPSLHSAGDIYEVRAHAVIAIPNPLTLSVAYRLVVSDISAESAPSELDSNALMTVLHRVCAWLESTDTWLLSGHPDVAMQATVDPDEVAKLLLGGEEEGAEGEWGAEWLLEGEEGEEGEGEDILPQMLDGEEARGEGAFVLLKGNILPQHAGNGATAVASFNHRLPAAARSQGLFPYSPPSHHQLGHKGQYHYKNRGYRQLGHRGLFL